jgi:hypothetical protein
MSKTSTGDILKYGILAFIGLLFLKGVGGVQGLTNLFSGAFGGGAGRKEVITNLSPAEKEQAELLATTGPAELEYLARLERIEESRSILGDIGAGIGEWFEGAFGVDVVTTTPERYQSAYDQYVKNRKKYGQSVLDRDQEYTQSKNKQKNYYENIKFNAPKPLQDAVNAITWEASKGGTAAFQPLRQIVGLPPIINP